MNNNVTLEFSKKKTWQKELYLCWNDIQAYEHEKSSEMKQEPPFCDRKQSNTLPQMVWVLQINRDNI